MFMYCNCDVHVHVHVGCLCSCVLLTNHMCHSNHMSQACVYIIYYIIYIYSVHTCICAGCYHMHVHVHVHVHEFCHLYLPLLPPSLPSLHPPHPSPPLLAGYLTRRAGHRLWTSRRSMTISPMLSSNWAM